MARTPKQSLLANVPNARLDYYELLRGERKPCWFIREGQQGIKLSPICATPREAWAAAASIYGRKLA
jgi:hypothetical protein